MSIYYIFRQPGTATGVLRQYPSLAALVDAGGASATERQVQYWIEDNYNII